MKELLEICAALRNLGDQPCALATVIQVEGSAYRKPGARMLLTPDGNSWGMVSGGCLEHDVLDHAHHALETGRPRVVRYDSTSDNDIIFGTGLGCNGIIDVLVEPISQQFRVSFVKAVEHSRTTRKTGGIATVIPDGKVGSSGQHAFFENDGWIGDSALIHQLKVQPPRNEAIVTLSDHGLAGAVRVFIQPLPPPIQLVIFGGWLDVVPLIRMAHEVGFHSLVVNSRAGLSSNRFFHEADAILACSPAEALPQIQFDSRTVAVLMNHNFERDSEALSALLRVPLIYLGMLGPKRRTEKMLAEVQAGGMNVSDEFRQNIHGPAGLDLGAKTPEEIALSIMAEILALRNARTGNPFRDPKILSPPAFSYA
jgi:xanthine/CO dehydrogenase XdhC/CoxF family maturation factor